MAHRQASASTVDWLLAGDPAIRWQVRRDLMASSSSAVEREQRRVATEGWGAKLLAQQDPEGTWAGRMYSPKWISTTYTMLLLRDLGLSPGNRQARKACELLLDRGFCRDGGIGMTFDYVRRTREPGDRFRPPDACIGSHPGD